MLSPVCYVSKAFSIDRTDFPHLQMPVMIFDAATGQYVQGVKA